MIFDRTQSDVEASKALINEKVKTFAEITFAEEEILERGTMTIKTLNRIEEKQAELQVIFKAMGYYNLNIENETWYYPNFFTADDFQRILENTNALRDAFFEYIGTPATPLISYYYEDVNALEKILHDLDQMAASIKANYKRCGTFRCGRKSI